MSFPSSSKAGVNIRADQRVAIVGKTGSGKTYLAEKLTAPLTRLVIVDPTGLLQDRFKPHVPWDDGVKALREGLAARVYLSLDNPAEYELFFAQIYRDLRQVTVYIDELYGVEIPTRPTPGLWALYTRGRARGIGVWACTQRPRFVPRFTLSEAEWFFVFRLSVPEDRRFLADIIHPAIKQAIKDEHGFYYYNIRWDRPRYTPRIT